MRAQRLECHLFPSFILAWSIECRCFSVTWKFSFFCFFLIGTYCFTTSRSWSTSTDPPPFLPLHPPHPPRSIFRKTFCIHTSHPPSKGARVRENTDFVLTIWLTLGRRQLNHFVNKYYWTYPTQIYQTQSLSHFLPYFSLLTAWHCQTSQPVRSQKPGNFWKRSPKTWRFQGKKWRFQGKNWRFQGKNWRFQGKLEIHVIMHKWKLHHSDLTFLFCVQGQLFLCTCHWWDCGDEIDDLSGLTKTKNNEYVLAVVKAQTILGRQLISRENSGIDCMGDPGDLAKNRESPGETW